MPSPSLVRLPAPVILPEKIAWLPLATLTRLLVPLRVTVPVKMRGRAREAHHAVVERDRVGQRQRRVRRERAVDLEGAADQRQGAGAKGIVVAQGQGGTGQGCSPGVSVAAVSARVTLPPIVKPPCP